MQTPQQKETVGVPLISEHKEQVPRRLERESDTAELTVEELEERITPRLASNHNETALLDC